MGCFLLNELGEVLLEIKSGLGFGADMRLEVNESAQSAVLRSAAESFAIDFVHEELMLPLKETAICLSWKEIISFMP